jgi:hypothetical protein
MIPYLPFESTVIPVDIKRAAPADVTARVSAKISKRDTALSKGLLSRFGKFVF